MHVVVETSIQNRRIEFLQQFRRVTVDGRSIDFQNGDPVIDAALDHFRISHNPSSSIRFIESISRHPDASQGGSDGDLVRSQTGNAALTSLDLETPLNCGMSREIFQQEAG